MASDEKLTFVEIGFVRGWANFILGGPICFWRGPIFVRGGPMFSRARPFVSRARPISCNPGASHGVKHSGPLFSVRPISHFYCKTQVFAQAENWLEKLAWEIGSLDRAAYSGPGPDPNPGLWARRPGPDLDPGF